MTHDLAWAEQVKSEYKELLGRITRLYVFLNSKPKISVQDISLLKEQYDAMRYYAEILLARLYLHNIEIDSEEESDNENGTV